MSEGFFIPPEHERSVADGNLIDPASGAHLRDIEGGMWVRGPDGTAMPAEPYLDALRGWPTPRPLGLDEDGAEDSEADNKEQDQSAVCLLLLLS
jgi:hypothetical protein